MINLIYSGNDKYFSQIFLSTLSIAKNTKEALNIYVMTLNCKTKKREFYAIKQTQIDLLNSLLKKYNNQSKVTLIDMEQLYKEHIQNSINIDTSYSPYSMLRLLAVYIKDIPDKLLYLDTDTMVYNDISELYNIDIKDYEYAACKDALGHYFYGYNYCNSGVLLLNIKKIRETKLFEKCINYVKSKKSIMPDQDALNYRKTKILIIDKKFNNQRKMTKDTVVKHFCKVLKFLPYIHTLNIKQTDIDSIHKILKIHEFDDIYEIYLEYKKQYPELLFN